MKEIVSNLADHLSGKKQFRLRTSNLFVTIGVMACATIVSVIFRNYDISEPNIVMVYLLGVLFVAWQTSGYLFGIIASFLGVMSFNYFFTVPYYTFSAFEPGYPFTFGAMLIVALITSTLTTNFKREAEHSKIRENRTQSLYNISKNLISTLSMEQTISTVTVSIANMSGESAAFYTQDASGAIADPFVYCINNGGMKLLLSEKCRETAHSVFAGEKALQTEDVYYVPVPGRKHTLGVIGIDSRGRKLSNEQIELLDTIAAQTALSIERELSYEKQQKSKVRVEGERLRNNLLHSVSHDLKTPLAGIVGASSTILGNWDSIDDSTKKSLISGIYDEAEWLNRSVENILSITRIEDGRIQVKKSPEAVEEIIAEAVERVQKHSGRHTIRIDIPESVMMVPMDGNLIEQVLVNLIDNAAKYTPQGSVITVKAYQKDKEAVFSVSDTGGGIDEKDLPYVFDRFYTGGHSESGRKGMGLGLAICKSIVLAHDGKITAVNGEEGGAVFTFTIPMGG